MDSKTNKVPEAVGTYGLKYDWRLYRCTLCGHETRIGTNHTGPCMNHCQGCSWKSTGFGPGVRMFGTVHRSFTYVGDKN